LTTTDSLGTQDSRLPRGEEVGDPLSGSSGKTDTFIHVEVKTREKEKHWGWGCPLPVYAKINMGFP
jgi:hypothetical protein